MEKVAAIDVGSNAVRLLIAQVGPGKKFEVVGRVRIPLRLGKEAFLSQKFSPTLLQQTQRVFARLSGLLRLNHVSTYSAVATSAFRESKNSPQLQEKVFKDTGILIKTVKGEEEAAIIWSAVKNTLPLKDRVSLLIDIGGGSVELIIVKNKKKVGQKSIDMGTLRLLQVQKNADEKKRAIKKFRDSVEQFFKEHNLGQEDCLLVGTGGNLRRMGKLRKSVLHKKKMHFINHDELKSLYRLLEPMRPLKRAKKFHMPQDRADVIVPAMEILLEIGSLCRFRKILLPNVGLADGLLNQMLKIDSL